MHPIRRYCRAHGISRNEFARKCGFSSGFVYRMTTTVRTSWIAPGREATKTIMRVTDGEIGALELWEFNP